MDQLHLGHPDEKREPNEPYPRWLYLDPQTMHLILHTSENGNAVQAGREVWRSNNWKHDVKPAPDGFAAFQGFAPELFRCALR